MAAKTQKATGSAATAAASAGTTNKSGGGVAAETQFSPSGAPQQVVADVDTGHPAVDANPRANTTADQNRIDFNDPGLSGAEAVEKALSTNTKPE